MSQFIKLFFTSAVIFLVVDIFWLMFAYKKIYQQYIGSLIGEFHVIPAIVFYIIYIAALTFFVLIPGIEKSSLSYVVLAGAFLGMVCYSTYDLTNLASIKNWSLTVTVVDIIWGSFVTSLSATLTYLIITNFRGG